MKIPVFLLAIVFGVLSIGCHPVKRSDTSTKRNRKASSGQSSRTATYPGLKASFDYEMLDDYTFKLSSASTDSTYGYTQQNPIHVGGGFLQGAANEHRYMRALKGPNGETITYVRKGSCCAFNTPNGMMGGGLLDRYEVTWENNSTPYFLYINMYDAAELKAPMGLTFKE
ncbi:hypothetical protein [Paraflavitalea pollutisoli]|uniref:hypothetical protein n=1 Tax=Paraflavitalea pollutisoli TaxID=3034143 RepID=UPI0023EC96B5|nr:hypothetical protein [Paraflavitalea sp. H1-2-19X]